MASLTQAAPQVFREMAEVMNNPPSLEFDYQHDRWANVNTCPVKDMAATWIAKPNKVVVCEDPKLQDEPLVILRKTHFEQITKTLEALLSCDAVLQHSLVSIGKQISVVRHLLEQDPKIQESVLGKAIEVLGAFQTFTKTDILVGSKPTELRPSSRPDPELSKLLPPEEDDDDDGNESS
jgi:hypothetical protein